MELKWVGAVLIILGCGLAGWSLAAKHRYAERCLDSLIRGLEFMSCELQFHLTPLPELCGLAGTWTGGPLGRVFAALSLELERQETIDAAAAMDRVLRTGDGLPEQVVSNLRLLGNSLGRFDLQGQLSGMETVRGTCRRDLEALMAGRRERLNSYRTLGLCTGAALAILLI